jgi:starch synthase
LRFAYLSRVAAELAMGRTTLDWQADLVHANDWHAGLLPLLLSLEREPRPATIFTAHNLAFQGNFPASVLPEIEIPSSSLTAEGCEFFGQISFLKAGLRYADRVTTVSPSYAAEVLTPEFGSGMEGVLRDRGTKFSGILNGIDDALWNPATDRHIRQNFRAGDIHGKRTCKIALQQELGLRVSLETPLIGFVSRLTHQKMADVVADAIPWIAEHSAQFALVGEGDLSYEAAFADAQARAPDNVAVAFGYRESLAHRLQAGCDILLAPARFEPCGLTQLYGLRYGAVPVVRRTGGLADTVVNVTPSTMADRSATGFVFEQPDLPSLVEAIGRALAVYKEPLAWRRLQLQGMAQDFSWNTSAEKYLALYRAANGDSSVPDFPSVEGDDALEAPLAAAQ